MVQFNVPDMTCGHCASTITKAVRSEDPKARVEISLGEHLVKVQSEPRMRLLNASLKPATPLPRFFRGCRHQAPQPADAVALGNLAEREGFEP
jgi:copper chaperone